jgi:hypothetical protein
MPTDNVPAAVIAGEPLADAAKAIRHRTLDERIEIGHAQAKALPLKQIGDPPRSGDAVVIAAYLGDDDTFADAVEVSSLAESHFVDGDHHRLTEAIAAGDLPAAESEDL